MRPSTGSRTRSRSSGRSTSSRRSSTTRGRSARSRPRTRCRDVFAMGGRVLFALSIAAIPEDMPRERFAAVFEGAAAKVREAGGMLAGGHTISDPEPKYGLAVIGVAPPASSCARAGPDRATSCPHQAPRDRAAGERESARQGSTGGTLPPPSTTCGGSIRAASEVLVKYGVASATDVTGFGLLGHGLEMARASGVRFAFDAAKLPALAGALMLAAEGVETGGAAHNRRFVAPSLEICAMSRAELVVPSHDPTDVRRPRLPPSPAYGWTR